MPDRPPASAPRAVFLSYASQDAAAAQRICDALRAAGVEVWFDQDELVGGDAWDAKIRGQIADCALFLPIISAATQARHEGYFRLEWKLAAQRTHMMSGVRAFLLPVVIDEMRDADAHVPDEFRAVQWTRLPDGEPAPAFCARVKTLLASPVDASRTRPALAANAPETPPATARPPTPPPRLRSLAARVALGALAVAVLAGVWFFALRPNHGADDSAKLAAAATAKPAPAKAPLSEARQLVARVYAAKLDAAEATRASFDAADRFCERAASLDSTDAEVWAAWAFSDAWLTQRFQQTSKERRESARIKAARAISGDPKSFHARLAQAAFFVLVLQGDSVARAESILQDLELEQPGQPEVVRLMVQVMRRSGRFEEELKLIDRLEKIPGYAATAHAMRGWSFRGGVGRFADAETEADKSLAIVSNQQARMLKLLCCLDWDGDLAAAKHFVGLMPPDTLLEDGGLLIANDVFFWCRDGEASLRLLKSVDRDWLVDNTYAGPKALLTGRAYLQANKPLPAANEFQAALKLVNQRLANATSDSRLLRLKLQLLNYLGDTDAAAETRRLLAQVDNSSESSRLSPDVSERIAELEATPVPSPRVTLAALRLDPEYDDLRAEPRFKALIARAEADPRLTPHRPMSTDTAGKSAPPDKSVAVLAFADNSPAHDSEYYSDGISEELIGALGKVPGLKVPAGTSSFYFKGKRVPMHEIARQLGVAYVIEGSVVRIGDQVKISARLCRATDGFQEMSETFTRDAKDVFAVEEEFAGLIAKKLSLKLGLSSAVATASVNPQAYELYGQGRAAWNLRSPEGFTRAEQLFHRALELSPDFARAQAALADVALLRAENVDGSIGAFNQRPSPELARITAQIRRVLALDPESAEAHASLGNALGFAWNFVESERELRRGIALNPNYASAHQWLAYPLFAMSQIDDALSEQQRAAELDPLSPRILDNLGHGLRQVGQYREALAAYDRALALQPSWFDAIIGKALTFVALGRTAEAVALARQLPAGNPNTLGYQILVFGQSGLKAEAEALLARLDAKGAWARTHLLLAVGRREEALAALDPASASPDLQPNFVSFEPLYDSIRDEPRFAQFLVTLGWTEAHARAQAWRAAHPPEKPAAKP